MKSGYSFANKDIVSVRDFTREEIDYVLKTAEAVEPLAESGSDMLRGKIMATLFFEPNTRTQLSFQTTGKSLSNKRVPDLSTQLKFLLGTQK